MVSNIPIVADNLTLYLAEIRKFKLLSNEEERYFAVKYYEENDLKAAHTLITSNLRYVVKLAFEYRHYGLKVLDLIQEGNIGLMMAVRKFNPYRGIRLISYAVWWIRAYIQNYIVSAWSLVKIGTTQAQKKLFYRLRKAKESLLRMAGSDENASEVAAMLQVPDHEVIDMDQRLKGDISLDGEIVQRDGLTVLDTIADDRMNQEELLGEYQQQRHLMQHIPKAMERLNEKERYIVEHRITREDPLTLRQLATHFSISVERVRQIEERALAKLRQILLPIILDSEGEQNQ